MQLFKTSAQVRNELNQSQNLSVNIKDTNENKKVKNMAK